MAAPPATYILMGKLCLGSTLSGEAMRWTSSVKAATYSGRVARLGRMLGLHRQHRQEARGAEGTALQAAREDREFDGAGVQDLGKREQAAAIRIGVAGEHDGEAGHKKSGASGGPGDRVEVPGS